MDQEFTDKIKFLLTLSPCNSFLSGLLSSHLLLFYACLLILPTLGVLWNLCDSKNNFLLLSRTRKNNHTKLKQYIGFNDQSKHKFPNSTPFHNKPKQSFCNFRQFVPFRQYVPSP